MPSTPNRGFSIPTTGTEIGVWGSNDVNPNFSALDGILGSVTSLNLAGTGSISLSASQQQVMVIRLTGAMTGNWTLTVNQPAFWIIDNQTTGNFVYTIGGATGQVISSAQGSKHKIAWDGTNAFFLDMPDPGTFMKLPVTATPAWMTACSIQPWLPCRGGTQLIATYPALAALVGTAFGGNGSTTFGIPDKQGRVDPDLDNGAGRISATSMSPNGNTLNAVGGDERPMAHNHTFTGNSPGQSFISSLNTNDFVDTSPAAAAITSGNSSAVATPTGSISTQFAGAGQNMPPAIVTGLTFMKT